MLRAYTYRCVCMGETVAFTVSETVPCMNKLTFFNQNKYRNRSQEFSLSLVSLALSSLHALHVAVHWARTKDTKHMKCHYTQNTLASKWKHWPTMDRARECEMKEHGKHREPHSRTRNNEPSLCTLHTDTNTHYLLLSRSHSKKQKTCATPKYIMKQNEWRTNEKIDTNKK